MKLIHLLIIGLFVVSIFSSCKRKCYDKANPDCEDYDPCHGKSSANFGFSFGSQWVTIESFLGVQDYVHDKDSVLISDNRIRFTASSIYDSVVWKLGIETIKDKSFVRVFNAVPEGTYSCRMIGYRPKQSCIKNDDGIDTVVKQWYMMPLSNMPIVGRYKVLYKGATDSTTVEILPWETYVDYSGQLPNRTRRIVVVSKNVKTLDLTLVNCFNSTDTVSSREFISMSQMISGHWVVFNDNGPIDVPQKGFINLQGDVVSAKYSRKSYNENGEIYLRNYEFNGVKIK